MENFFIYKRTKINYEFINGEGNNLKPTLLFLHGWGANIGVMKIIGNQFKDFDKLYIDFPPFGSSEEPQNVWDIFDYAELVKLLCDKLSLKNLVIISHSFGGRVALILSNVYNENINKIILVDSAGLKPRYNFSYYFKVTSFKLRHLFNKNAKGGSADYKKLSDNMKQTFKNVVNTNLAHFAKNNKIESLIIWGEKDKETPLYMAKKLNKLIKNSGLVILNDAGHFSFLDNFNEFIIVLKNFVN